MGTTKNKHTTNKVYWAVVGVLVLSACCLFAIALAYLQPKKTAPPAATPANTALPTLDPAISPLDQLRENIRQALSPSNRGLPERLTDFSMGEAGDIHVDIALNDNITDDLRRHGAKMDVATIINLVAHSGVDYNLVVIKGTFALVDQYGNTSEGKVLGMTYTRETLEKINWDNLTLITSDIYDLVEYPYTPFFHPDW